MTFGTRDIFVSDMGKSVRFYKELLQGEPLYANDDQWMQFSNKIALHKDKSWNEMIEYGVKHAKVERRFLESILLHI